ncbi:NifU family protein [Mycolicibacterium mageritense]|uniref:Fe/S biogenesis protein NfuA n=1 Tax=Mycolicibacterium mageritense TaxID=53462 RepID=A0AAI8XNX1_MYCME|nr:NifU family protein [Mycolicibacterium mageritense]BDY29337.1 Fe/S biogenesis protein NfuA [Mycolicibacterium mageritense]
MSTTTRVAPTARPVGSAAQPSESEPDFETLAKRVDAAIAALADLDDGPRSVAEEVKAAIEAVHRVGLTTMVRRMRADAAARPVLFDLVDDPVVHLLLSLHGIVRPDPMTHANRVLAEVRPQLQSHGGDVSLIRIEDGIAFVRLEGACNGCSMSSVTLRSLVESALVDNVPSVTGLEVLPNQPSPTLIPLEALRVGPDPASEGWVSAGPAGAVSDGQLVARNLASSSGASADVIVVNVGQRFSAYRNECAHEGLPMDNAVVDTANGTLTCPWHGFCYDAGSGECLSAPGAQLEQLPIRIDSGEIWVRVAV